MTAAARGVTTVRVDSARPESYAAPVPCDRFPAIDVSRRSKMIITPKIQGTGVLLSLGRRSAPWIVAFAAGSIFLACSGTIDTPTDEYPSRSNATAADDDDDDRPAANDEDDDTPAARPPAAPADDEDDRPAQPAANEDDDPPVDEEPPVEEEPAEEPAGGGGVAFEADVFPILSVACAPCHAGSGFGGNNIGG